MLKYLLKLFFSQKRALLPSKGDITVYTEQSNNPCKSPQLSTVSSMLAHQVQGESWSRLLREVMSPSMEKHKNPTEHGPEEPALEILL